MPYPIRKGGYKIPFGAFNGNRAITVQSYDEANKKNGVQWEASRIIEGATNGQLIYSLLSTGDNPIDLKSRVFGYTGTGVIGRFYIDPILSVSPTEDPVYNLTDIFPQSKDFQLFSGFGAGDITDIGTKVRADIHAIGPSTNQSQGLSPKAFGTNYILAPNTDYLLEIESLDGQDISARIELYNGPLDLPLDKLDNPF